MSSDEDLDDEFYAGPSTEPPEAATNAVPGGKFASAFAKILGKRKTSEANKTVTGVHKLEQKALKLVKEEEKEHQDAAARVRQSKAERLALKKRGHAVPEAPGVDPEAAAFERRLLVTATKGVVRLFNAVRKEQREITEEEGEHAVARQKVASMSSFLENVKVAAKKRSAAPPPPGRVPLQMTPAPGAGTLVTQGPSSTWEVFREDFLTGRNKLKDWDKGAPAEATNPNMDEDLGLGGGDNDDDDEGSDSSGGGDDDE